MQKNKILLVGPYPPPYGGISVQVSELQNSLLKKEYDCEVIDTGAHRRKPTNIHSLVRAYIYIITRIFSFAAKGYLIHLLTNGHNIRSWIYSLVCSCAGIINGKKTILTFGSGKLPEYISQISFLETIPVKIAVQLAGIVIVRNSDSKKAIVSLGVQEHKIKIISGFFGLKQVKKNELPQDLTLFLKNHSPIIGAHAGLPPEYGTPLLLEAASTLKRRYPSAGLILLGLGRDDQEKFALFIKQSVDIFLPGLLPHNIAMAVMSHLDVFVRATFFDGDSKSVREALALGVPVVASKTDFRPDGVILFEIGDLRDLTSKLTSTLDNLVEIKRNTAGREQKTADSLGALLALYHALQ